METLKKYLSEFKNNFKQLPLDVKSIFWFSLLISMTGIVLRLPADKELYKEIIPYTGWSPGSGYGMISVFILIYSSIETPRFNRVFMSRLIAIGFLGLRLIFGIEDWLEAVPDGYVFIDSLLYFRYDPLQPIYAIFLPLFWILIIGWPLMKNLLNKKPVASV